VGLPRALVPRRAAMPPHQRAPCPRFRRAAQQKRTKEPSVRADARRESRASFRQRAEPGRPRARGACPPGLGAWGAWEHHHHVGPWRVVRAGGAPGGSGGPSAAFRTPRSAIPHGPRGRRGGGEDYLGPSGPVAPARQGGKVFSEPQRLVDSDGRKPPGTKVAGARPLRMTARNKYYINFIRPGVMRRFS